MPLPVVTVAAGGLPVVEVASYGLPITEAANARGIAVTKVVGKPGLPVTFVTADGAVVPPVVFATWDPAAVTAVTLSGGNLAATNTGTTSADQGARVASGGGKTSGKYYFEITWTVIVGTLPGGANSGAGIGTPASTYTGMGSGGTTGVHHFRGGSTWSNGSQILAGAGNWAQGSVAGFAVDLDNRRYWKRASPAGQWNNSGTANPDTNTGGLIIPAGTMVPFVTFGGTNGLANNVITANFGASAFSGAVPSGFTAGWPA
jgi:hypothetical protein